MHEANDRRVCCKRSTREDTRVNSRRVKDSRIEIVIGYTNTDHRDKSETKSRQRDGKPG